MTQNYELETILTMTTGKPFVDDFDKVFKLVWFVCNNPLINTYGLGSVKDSVVDHLITLYPELKEIDRKEAEGICKFLASKDETYNKSLPVTMLGRKLPNKEKYNNDLHEILEDYRYYKNANKKHR